MTDETDKVLGVPEQSIRERSLPLHDQVGAIFQLISGMDEQTRQRLSHMTRENPWLLMERKFGEDYDDHYPHELLSIESDSFGSKVGYVYRQDEETDGTFSELRFRILSPHNRRGLTSGLQTTEGVFPELEISDVAIESPTGKFDAALTFVFDDKRGVSKIAKDLFGRNYQTLEDLGYKMYMPTEYLAPTVNDDDIELAQTTLGRIRDGFETLVQAVNE